MRKNSILNTPGEGERERERERERDREKGGRGRGNKLEERKTEERYTKEGGQTIITVMDRQNVGIFFQQMG